MATIAAIQKSANFLVYTNNEAFMVNLDHCVAACPTVRFDLMAISIFLLAIRITTENF
jgi:hypothetical protein